MSKQVKLTAQEKRNIIKDHKSGMTCKELSKKYALSASYICYKIIEIHPGKGRSLKSKILKDDILRMVKLGFTRAEIVEEMGLSRQHIHKIIKDNLEQKDEIAGLTKRIKEQNRQLNKLAIGE